MKKSTVGSRTPGAAAHLSSPVAQRLILIALVVLLAPAVTTPAFCRGRDRRRRPRRDPACATLRCRSRRPPGTNHLGVTQQRVGCSGCRSRDAVVRVDHSGSGFRRLPHRLRCADDQHRRNVAGRRSSPNRTGFAAPKRRFRPLSSWPLLGLPTMTSAAPAAQPQEFSPTTTPSRERFFQSSSRA